MRRLLIVTTGLILVLSLLVTATRFMGHTDESPLVIVENTYHCSPEPCWHNIRPGVTTWDQALATLPDENAGEGEVETIYFQVPSVASDLQGQVIETQGSGGPTGGVAEIDMAFPLTLADAIMLYGTPTTAEICSTDGDVLVVFFKGNISIMSNMDNVSATNDGNSLAPGFLFDSVTYDSGTGTSSAFTHRIPWRGFTALSDYVCSDDK